jgi:hypothetical protein
MSPLQFPCNWANKGNVFTQARNADHTLWEQGNRETPRLDWLLAPESAFKGVNAYNTGMQHTGQGICDYECVGGQVIFHLATYYQVQQVMVASNKMST